MRVGREEGKPKLVNTSCCSMKKPNMTRDRRMFTCRGRREVWLALHSPLGPPVTTYQSSHNASERKYY